MQCVASYTGRAMNSLLVIPRYTRVWRDCIFEGFGKIQEFYLPALWVVHRNSKERELKYAFWSVSMGHSQGESRIGTDVTFLGLVCVQVPGDATEVAWDCRILTFPAEMSPKNQVLWGRCSGDP